MDFKNIFTNLIGLFIVIASAVDTYVKTLNGSEIDWWQLVLAVAAALIAYLTGKDKNGKAVKS